MYLLQSDVQDLVNMQVRIQVNRLHSYHLCSSQGATHRTSNVYDRFERFVCVFIMLSFQNIIVNHGLDSGFPSREENGIGIRLTFTNYLEDIES